MLVHCVPLVSVVYDVVYDVVATGMHSGHALRVLCEAFLFISLAISTKRFRKP